MLNVMCVHTDTLHVHMGYSMDITFLLLHVRIE
jgi:hypothetical protein